MGRGGRMKRRRGRSKRRKSNLPHSLNPLRRHSGKTARRPRTVRSPHGVVTTPLWGLRRPAPRRAPGRRPPPPRRRRAGAPKARRRRRAPPAASPGRFRGPTVFQNFTPGVFRVFGGSRKVFGGIRGSSEVPRGSPRLPEVPEGRRSIPAPRIGTSRFEVFFCSASLLRFRAFLGLLECPRRHGWLRLEVLVRTRPWIDPWVDFQRTKNGVK